MQLSKAIVTGFNQDLMDYAKVMIKTFSENYHGDALPFYCLVPENILDREQEFVGSLGINNLVIKFVSSSERSNLIKLYPDNPYWSVDNAAHKMFLSSLFPDIDYVIYIDPLSIILQDVQSLLDHQIGEPFGAIVEISDANLEVFKDDTRDYYNVGVFIANLYQWRSDGYEKLLINDLLTVAPTKNLEQDVFNRVFYGKTEIIPSEFNFLSWSERFNSSDYLLNNVILVHFLADPRPWQKDAKIVSPYYVDIWRKKYLDIVGIDIQI